MTAPTVEILTLAELKHGDKAVVTAISTEQPGVTGRLAARGIVPGIQIGVLKSGDPLLIGVDNDRWAINRSEANCISVDRIQKRHGLFGLFRR